MRTPAIIVGGLAAAAAATAVGLTTAHAASPLPLAPSTTPIKHVVVIFGENESFDHYFGTYPNATNPAGEPHFDAAPNTPSVNGLNDTLLTNNPNSANPKRLDRSQAVTCSQNHGYSAEQSAENGGLMNKFPEFTSSDSCAFSTGQGAGVVMDYYDGNTVTGLWNLAQHFSMSDNSYDTQFGPSTVGAINLVSGETHGTDIPTGSGVANSTVIGDPDPSAALDDCGVGGAQMSGQNVGDLLNAHSVSWGWFEGGFRPTTPSDGTSKAVCGSTHVNVANGASKDYVAHHDPFEYYKSTDNAHHLPPSSAAMIGSNDQANHQYDMTDFDTALANNALPSVSFLKAAAFEDAHPSNSDPLDEQRFVARTLNALEQSPEWSSTAVIIAYDDSDGWYDHQMDPIVSGSNDPNNDTLNGKGVCGGTPANAAIMGRCGYGQRLPLMVISPYAKQNYVDHSITDQTSVLRFIEDNWNLGRIDTHNLSEPSGAPAAPALRTDGAVSMDSKAGSLNNMFDFSAGAKPAPPVYLDPNTGEVVKTPPNSGPPSGNPTPTPTPTATVTSTSVTTTVTGSVDGTSQDLPTTDTLSSTKTNAVTTQGKPAKVTLSCSTKGSGKKIAVTCTAKGADASAQGIAVRFRIEKGSKLLGTKATKLSKGTAKATVKVSRSLKKGAKYTLRVSVASKGGVLGLTKTIKV